MREFWFVLRPSELTYFKTRSEKDKCGALPIEMGSRVEPTTGYRIILHTPERNFELGEEIISCKILSENLIKHFRCS